jgi:hypothetical protein
MPLYEFRYKDTGEVFEKMMSFSSKEEYLTQNPNVESVITSAPPTIDSVRLGVRKTDQGFKEVLQRIHEKTPGSVLNQTTKQL